MDNADYQITLDITDMSAPISLNVKRGDAGRVISVNLAREGVPVGIEPGSYAVFAGKKPDDKILWNSCSIRDNTIFYEITKQTTAVVGWVPVQIRLYRPGGKLVSSPDFVLIVDGTVTEDDEIIAISENEVTALTELVSEVSDAIEYALNVEGKSAYQVAQEAGFEGTVEEWLDSLVGARGERGPQGVPGPQGEQGEQGIPGKDGSSTTITLKYGLSSTPSMNTVTGWQETIPQMSETYPYLWIEITTETKTANGGSNTIEAGIIGYYSSGGSGGNADQSGLSAEASELLITILRNGVYSTNQSANITGLANALSVTEPDEPDIPVEPDDPEVVTYTITNNLTNVNNSNSASTVEQGSSYSATLTAADGYELDSVTVTMGGVDITSTVYLDGSINIATVSGDIVITATAKAGPVEVPLTKMSTSGGNTVYSDGGETVLWENKYIGFNYISEAIFEKDTPVTLTITTSGAVGQGLYTAYCNDGGIGKVYYYAENFVGYPHEDRMTQAGTYTFEVMAKAGYHLVILANENYAPAVTNITAARNGG